MNQNPSRIYIVEDGAIARANLENTLEMNGYEIAGSAAKAQKALAEIPDSKTDLLLLDINLTGKHDGIWLAHEMYNLQLNIPIIYLTAYSDRDTLTRLKETKPSGYIKKPFDNSTLFTSIDLAIMNASTSLNGSQEIKSEEDNVLFIKDGFKKSKIHIKNIVYMKSDGNYLRIVLTNATYFIREKLQNILDQLPPHHFVQIHRSSAINVTKVDSINKNIITIEGKEFTVTNSYRDILKMHLAAFYE